ncbi:MAG: hypothetical protein PHC44_09300 [Lutispora sp.]|nr:hypothetical protein [Lutispora sp.]
MENYDDLTDGQDLISPIQRAIKDMVKYKITTIGIDVGGGNKEYIKLSRDEVIPKLLQLNISAVKMAVKAMVDYRNDIRPIDKPIAFAKTVLYNEPDQWEAHMQQVINDMKCQYRIDKTGGSSNYWL